MRFYNTIMFSIIDALYNDRFFIANRHYLKNPSNYAGESGINRGEEETTASNG